MFLVRSIPGVIMLMDFLFGGLNGQLRDHHFCASLSYDLKVISRDRDVPFVFLELI